MKKTAIISFGTTLAMPLLALAQNTGYIDGWISAGTRWLSTAITVIMVLMTLWFLISVFRYIAEKDPGKLKDRRKVMINGLIGLFVAVSVWGIISIARNTLGTTNSQAPGISCPPGTYWNGNRCVI